MDLPERDALPEPVAPRLLPVRQFHDTRGVVELLQANRAVLVVLHASDEDRRRTLDLLAGWALGAGGDLDEIGPNAVLARPPNTPPVRLSRSGIVSAVDAVFSSGVESQLRREDEQRLLGDAASGSPEARRRLIDAYAEFASVVAAWIRPARIAQATAVRIAQEELDRLVAWPPRDTPLLVALVEAIHRALS